jgi:AraC-like DNA-binding protein
MELPRGFRTEPWLNSPLETPIGTIHLAGRLRDSAGVGASTMRVLERFCLVLLVHGEGLYRDARGAHVQLRPGDVVTVFPDLPHTYGPLPGKRWNEVYVVFSGPVFDLWRRSGLLNPERPVIHLEPEEYWYQRFTEIVHRDAGPVSSRALRTLARFQSLVLDALAASRQADEGLTRAEWLETGQQLLAERFRDRWLTPREVAAKVGLSYDNFRKQFSRHAGMPPQNYQKHKRIEHACAAIYEGNKSLKEIASDLEFCDVFHFSKAFKQVVGSSPSEFRKRVLGS